MSGPIIWGPNNTAECIAPGGLSFPSGNGGTGLATQIITTVTLAQMQALTGANGQIVWNSTYKAAFQWVNDRWWPFGIPDPRYGFMQQDEFAGSDRIGQLDWQTSAGSLPQPGNLLNPGIYRNSISAASSMQFFTQQGNCYQIGTMDLYFEAIVTIPTLSNGVDNAVYIVGFNDGFAYDAHGACTDGAYFSLDYAVDQTHWCTNTSNNGTNTQKISVLAAAVPAAGTFYRLGIYVNAGVGATFYVNGVAITAQHTTNLPTGAGRQTCSALNVHKTLGAGAVSLNFDAISIYGFFNGQRVA